MKEGKREPARWIFSKELRETTVIEENTESEKVRSMFLTPLGSIGRRILFVGKVTNHREDEKSIRLTVSDPTGAFYLSFFERDFNQNVKRQLEKIELNQNVTVMGRVSHYTGEDGKILFNINPELIYETDLESMNFWNARTAYLCRRRIMRIKEALKKPDTSPGVLTASGATEDEAEGIMKSIKAYPNYDYTKFEEVLSSLLFNQQISQNINIAKAGILELLSSHVDMQGIKYEDIVNELSKKGISQNEIDEALNVLGHEGDIFEVSLKRYRKI